MSTPKPIIDQLQDERLRMIETLRSIENDIRAIKAQLMLCSADQIERHTRLVSAVGVAVAQSHRAMSRLTELKIQIKAETARLRAAMQAAAAADKARRAQVVA